MAYQGDDYTDLVTATLRNLERTTWADIVVDNQRHIALPRILKKKAVEFGSGYGHQFNVRLFSNNAARNVKLNEVDNPTTADTQKTGNIPWRHSETHWSLEERIISMNRSPARLVNLLQTSRVDAMTDMAELCETNFWSKPGSSSDSLDPFGVPYWVTTTGYSTTGGFDGGRPVGFTDVGGLDPNTYPRWKNWTYKYVNVSKPDLIRGWREAATKTDFRPPVDGPYSNMGSMWGYYTNYSVLSTLEEILESQNDNLGNDVASKDSLTTFRRIGVEWVPWFDNNSGTTDTTDPVYGLNWSVFKPCFLTGEYMKETKVKPHPYQHRTLVQYTDLTHNFFCVDRRKNFVLSK
jgi:hypothetical protein